MKKFFILLFVLSFSNCVNAEYMCGQIPFVPNKPENESCGIYCTTENGFTTFPVVNPEYYALKLYPRAKDMYDKGLCEPIEIIKSYPEKECGGTVYEKQTKSMGKWTEMIGGNEACRMQQFQRQIELFNKTVEETLNNF